MSKLPSTDRKRKLFPQMVHRRRRTAGEGLQRGSADRCER
jgi:hypothetical protein